jgi:hypothetical protein
VCPNQTAILERHTIEVGELEIRYPVDDLGRTPNGFCKARLIKGREPHEACAPASRNIIRRIIGREEGTIIKLVEWNQPGNSPRHPGMTGQRLVFRSRQRQALLYFGKRCRQCGSPNAIKGQSSEIPFHRISN